MYNFTLRFHNATYKYEEKGHVYDFFLNPGNMV